VVFGIFGSKVERLKKAVRQRYGQHEPRKDAMIRLLQMGDLEAYRAVLSRFTVNCDSPHWDEKEKSWLAGRLLERTGDAALLQALDELLMTGERLNQALSVAQRLMGRDQFNAQVQAAFEKRLGDHRAVDACVELIAAMGEIGGDTARRGGLAAVRDHTDEVILAGLAILEKAEGEGVAEALYNVAFDPLQMPRVVRRAGQVIATLELVDPEGRNELTEALAEDFELQGGRLVART
tara:strand:- start:57 stop:764 length:708 start_codon:yes stop_codon:yes gene_type:complete